MNPCKLLKHIYGVVNRFFLTRLGKSKLVWEYFFNKIVLILKILGILIVIQIGELNNKK